MLVEKRTSNTTTARKGLIDSAQPFPPVLRLHHRLYQSYYVHC